MSESSKKKLKQSRLPFAVLRSEETTEKSALTSPEAVKSPSPKTTPSRKRKPSEGNSDNLRSKIGRVNDLKENIETQKDVIEVQDSEEELPAEDVSIKLPKDIETTPTTPAPESVFHIKLPSCNKSKRKVNMERKPPQSVDEEDPDDSVVYLSNEEIQKSTKKNKKKSEKKKKKRKAPSTDGASRVKKALKLNIDVEDVEAVSVDGSDDEAPNDTTSNENLDKLEPMDTDDVPIVEKVEEIAKADAKDDEDRIKTIPSTATLEVNEDPDTMHDEIIDMLSDDSGEKPSPNNDPDKVAGAKFDITKLTPKQLARRQEQEARRIEKEHQHKKERELKEQQRLKEKEQREEAKRKEKEEKEEARKREKDEKDRKRQAEQDKKDEEKRLKEEERKRAADQREEEKRQKEEERKRQVELREEEKRKREEVQKKKEVDEENRKKRAAQAFSKFFVPKKKADTSLVEDETSKDSAESSGESVGVVKSNFMPFQIRERMMLAPCVRLVISKEKLLALDRILKSVEPSGELYLKLLKSGAHKPGSSERTRPADDTDDVVILDELNGVGEDIEVDEEKVKTTQRVKYLMFHENRRPAYHGTWRKKSANISARRPFAQDTHHFDYEVDSDEEWEEEEPGESLHGSGSEKDKEEEDDYDIDNDFFVPHGHLSDEEMQQNDDEDAMEDNHPEAQKAKLKILQQEFAAEMKKKTEKIKPRLIGCIWMNGDEDENGCSKSSGVDKKYHCSDVIWRILKARQMMTSDDGVKLEENLEPELAEPNDEKEKALPKTPAQQKNQQRAKFTIDSVKELIRLVHGNVNGKKFILREFQAFRLKNFHKNPDFQEFSVKSVEEKMMEISDYKTCPEEGPLFGKKCWLVKAEVIQEHFGFGDETLKLPNEWTYILEKEVKEKKPKQPAVVDGAKKEESTEKSPKAVKPEEVQEKPKEVSKPPPTPPAPVVKKRVQLLMSVPRGQSFSESNKTNLISTFLKGNQKPATGKAQSSESKMDVDEVILID